MEFIKKAVKVGNSAGVILPKKLLGSEVKIKVIRLPVNIKEESLKLLKEFLPDIRGVYILNKNPAEVLAISKKIKKIIKSKIKLSIIPFSIIKRDIENPELKQKLMKAETIINYSLLAELKRL